MNPRQGGVLADKGCCAMVKREIWSIELIALYSTIHRSARSQENSLRVTNIMIMLFRRPRDASCNCDNYWLEY
jgi:hypothetical protein